MSNKELIKEFVSEFGKELDIKAIEDNNNIIIMVEDIPLVSLREDVEAIDFVEFVTILNGRLNHISGLIAGVRKLIME